ncbi:MAG: DNA mismatch repair protein MutS, partial [Clostridiales bacterium]|nr:DNA mismatch repair protein MutS [Clostridiales bacterium]
MEFNLNELMSKVTPMMQQYIITKQKHPDALLFYRLGDFYEMFFDDALIASRELELTLTGRDCGMEQRAPMCGVPYHACEKYIARLIERGYKVAICEQIEDPATAKGLVARDVIRIVTPGTLIEQSMLEEDKNNYILSVYLKNGTLGMAYTDISTGEFYVKQLSGEGMLRAFKADVSSISPKETVYNSTDAADDDFKPVLSALSDKYTTPYYDWCYSYKNAYAKLNDHFGTINLAGFGIEGMDAAIVAAGALLEYLYDTQRGSVKQILSVKVKHSGQTMYMDTFTRRNLELTENMRTQSKKGSLLGFMDKTVTSMGARMLHRWLCEPLLQYFEIEARLDCTEALMRMQATNEALGDALKQIRDIERIASRISAGTVGPRELVSLRQSLEVLPTVKEILDPIRADMLVKLVSELDVLEDISNLIKNTISDNAPNSVKDGNVIAEGYSAELDRLRSIMNNGASWLAQMEQTERDRTGIKGLKIRYNKVFGYYIDVTNSYKDLVPSNYIRRQTLANSERYVTEELKKFEDEILNAETRVTKIEAELFEMIRGEIAAETARLQATAQKIATIDCLQSMARLAADNNYVRPHVNTNGVIDIKNGRHPVIESRIQRHNFVPNDVYLDNGDNKVMLITGPNMAGKSTYMRQVAIMCFMMQVGSFLPCDSADICIVDKIFARAGATDDISQGQSTFMVEMNEVASILHSATPSSLMIFDEIGRGTSTYDGMSIAWAVAEHVANTAELGAKTLFATHYHELSELEGRVHGIKNYHVITKEYNDDIVFLRKIVAGEALHSYGIQV